VDISEALVVGGGPAGSYCAYELAQKGVDVLILDHSLPREKACGGGITQKVVEKFPFMKRFCSAGFASPAVKMISCIDNVSTTTRFRLAFHISRMYLDQEILNLALAAGAEVIKEKVMDLKRGQGVWKVRTNRRVILAKTLIGADGINSIVRRRIVGPIPREDLGLGFGYLVTGVENELTTIKFLDAFPGYIWIFSRGDRSCIGIGSELRYGSQFRNTLDKFIKAYCPEVKIISRFAAMLPMAKNPEFFEMPAQGEDWVLIGDAAGHADPITGEGILYALWSAKLAAQAIERNDLASYDKSWRDEYGNSLKIRSSQRDAFYNPLRIELMPLLLAKDAPVTNFFSPS
jgi:geranylgeranyl reductase family protein